MACNFLKENVIVENCIFNYYFADKYQCLELQKKARGVINSNFTAVMETYDFLNLNTKQVMEWVSSDDITVNAEEEVFNGIVKWVSHNKSEREVDFPNLLHQVRLVSISHDFLLNKLVKEELVAKNTELSSYVVLDAMRVMVSGTETHADAIFVCGGRRSLGYFPQQNVWYQLANMLRDHNLGHMPNQCRGKIYIPCQTFSDKHFGTQKLMQYYTPSSDSWGAVQVATTFTYSAVLKGDLYAIHESYESEETHRYNFENNCFNELKEPPTTHYECCVVADEQYIYIIGGSSRFIEHKSLPTTLRFEPSADEWDEVAPINEPRCNAFGAAMNGKVYVAGGQWKNKVLSTCEVYSPLTNEWQLMPSLEVPRISASMVCHGGKLYVLGGCNYITHGHKRSQRRVLSVEVFDFEKDWWKEKSIIPVKCFEADEKEEKNKFNACFARLCKGVIDKLKPLG